MSEKKNIFNLIFPTRRGGVRDAVGHGGVQSRFRGRRGGLHWQPVAQRPRRPILHVCLVFFAQDFFEHSLADV